MIINLYNKKHLIKIDTDAEFSSDYQEICDKIKSLHLSNNEINISLPFADVHTHGAMGFDFSDASEDQMKLIDKFYLDNGIGFVLPTLVALSREDYKKQITSILNIIKKGNTSFIGINIEGPFINSDKKGAINDKNIVPIDLNLAKELWEISEGNIKLMTVAPELENFDKLAEFAENKFIISLGHSCADYEIAVKALEFNSVNHITHLFNAMNSLHHRNPSLIGAAMENSCMKEAICDGVHLNDGIIKMIFRLMSDEIVIVSDSVSACGLKDGVYKLGGLDVYVNNQKATLKNGTIAGSCKSISEQVKHLKALNISNEKILYSACELPLKSINISYPNLENSNRFNILDSDFKLIEKYGY